MTRITQTEITHPCLIKAICQIQTRFVIAWNAAEINHGIGQTDELPAGARYSATGRGTGGGTGGGPARGAAFVLPTGTMVYIHAKSPWWHWQEGWSFCRNTLSPDQVLKVVVHGPKAHFHKWYQDAMVEDMEQQQRAHNQRLLKELERVLGDGPGE